MIPRYENPRIAELFTNRAKLRGWQEVELAVIRARVALGTLPEATFNSINVKLQSAPFDIDWWLARDKAIHHDLNAFIEERVRHLPPNLSSEFHRDMTSYDTEDPAFARTLLNASAIVQDEIAALDGALTTLARGHRFTVMIRRTHGQAAKLGTFGGRVLSWIAPLSDAVIQLDQAVGRCTCSRISGAVGNYGGNMTPELEREALSRLGLDPYYGATQITPRNVYAPLAQALLVVAEVVGKMAIDIRLTSRSGLPLTHEPFAKIQKGSSAMPHKKNPIRSEQIEGLVRMVRGRVSAITSSICTWEERAIEQSCVERVDWPDLFHLVSRIVTVMTQVISGLAVYPDNMLKEVIETRGTYASDEAKNFLAEEFAKRGISSETAYRVIQLASFDVFEPDGFWSTVRHTKLSSFAPADEVVSSRRIPKPDFGDTIKTRIAEAKLEPVTSLAATAEDVEKWNRLLRSVFADEGVRDAWEEVFMPSRLLEQEQTLFRNVLDT